MLTHILACVAWGYLSVSRFNVLCFFFFLHPQNLQEGTLLLGCVKEVTDFEVTVGLPCGMEGFLSIMNICDSYTKLLNEQLDSDDTEVGFV